MIFSSAIWNDAKTYLAMSKVQSEIEAQGSSWHLSASFRIALLLSVCLLSNSAHSSDSLNEKRPGYSYFGLGPNLIDYDESTALQINESLVDVETASTVNIAQQSGTYVSITSDWGFYLDTSTTLGESRNDERWLVNDTSIRTNKVSFEQQRLSFVLSKHYRATDYLLFGAQYSNAEFKRFAQQLTDEASSFGLDENSFESGTESETVLELSLVAGLERSTLFKTSDPGWRYRGQFILGLPLLTRISNTEINNGESFSEEFNGFVAHLRTTYGYQFNRNLLVGFNLDVAVSKREAIDRGVADNTGITRFPENTLIFWFPSVALFWSF